MMLYIGLMLNHMNSFMSCITADCAKDVCSRNPCLNNGTCRASSGSTYECMCPLGVVGVRCNTPVTIHLPAYTGNSYTVYKGLQGTSRSQTSLMITLMPRSPDGLLIYEGLSSDKRGDFISILLTDGHLVAVWDLGSGAAFLRSTNKLAMDTWHTVEFWHIGREGFLRLNSEPELQSAFSVGDLVQLTLGQELYLGGHPDVDHVAASLTTWVTNDGGFNLTGFQGCIQQLLLNGISVQLIDQMLHSSNVDNCREHACSSPASACSNRGQCVPKQSAFQCSCLLGYTGSFCQEKIMLDKTSRISFDGDGYLEFTDRSFLNMVNTPHFDIYMDVRVQMQAANPNDRVARNFSRDQILLGLMEETNVEKRILLLTVTARDRLSLSWIRFHSQSGLLIDQLPKNRTTATTMTAMMTATIVAKRESPFGQEVQPGYWQKIMLKRRSNDYLLFLNGTHTETVNLEQGGIVHPTFTKLLIGGLNIQLPIFVDGFSESDDRQPLVTQLSPMDRKSVGFRGCIGHIHMNGRPTMAGDAQSGRNVNACEDGF
ncbi:unnamed protein product [Echinostoma caproni]|uniref:EGF-like domain-containing protein n=1 Tax=Echinostoma caproni TaxID=27848 RepID=A0A183AR27_9TREM|nr:unnamed protein product [Echinostoma caproni]